MDVLYIGKIVTVIAKTPQDDAFPFRRTVRDILEAAEVKHIYKNGGTNVGEIGNTPITNFTAPCPSIVINALKTSKNRRALFGYIYDYKIDYEHLLGELKGAVWLEVDGQRVEVV